MEFGESMFATEVLISDRYKSPTNRSSSIHEKKEQIRLRQVKSRMKKANEELNSTMKDFLRAKNSLEQKNKRTQKMKMEFLKLYGNKKMRMHEKSLLNEKKDKDEEMKRELAKKVKTMKINNELGLMYTRNECELTQAKMREHNRRDDDQLRNTIRLKKLQQESEAKEKFYHVKKGENDFLIRKSNMSAMQNTRSRHNYLLKISKQIQILENYTDLMEKANNVSMSLTSRNEKFNKIPKDEFSKSFFITTKNTFKE